MTRRYMRKAMLPRRSHLAVVVLPNETSAFEAYRLLQIRGISPEHLAIVGEGYSSPERVGLLEPMQIALRDAQKIARLAGTVGAIGGLGLSLSLVLGMGHPLNLPLVAITPAATLVGGFWGAVVGALIGFLGEGSAAGIYRHYLRQGRYLLMMEGPEKLVQSAQAILGQFSHASNH
ncbi:MAG: hypothetical protein SFW36_15060 [Leptolyngbyaceae cyanobacterium bins.59]|nr:hypothetical protein [Leptolyngbyaceae cyanobacterium bins.59]